jgi:hypothetical protein
VIGRQWIDAGFHIGEILAQQPRDVGIERSVAEAGRRGRRLARALGRLPPREFAHDHALAHIPGQARQLGRSIGDAGRGNRDGIGHDLCSTALPHNMGSKRKPREVGSRVCAVGWVERVARDPTSYADRDHCIGREYM